jgi:hypothetical protein
LKKSDDLIAASLERFPNGVEFISGAKAREPGLGCLVMNLLSRFIVPSILVLLCLLAVPTPTPAQATSGKEQSPTGDALLRDEAASLQKKAHEAQARIRGNEGDSNQLKRAVKLTDVPLAKEILLRNGFTAKDLENAKISLRTGGGKGGEDTIEISVTCCDPKEITIQRTLEYFTK